MKGDSKGPLVAVIILNWNGANLLKEFLPSVISNTDPAEGKVIVVDNGSTDDSLKVLDTEFPSVEVFPLGHNYGFAEGYNIAVRHYRKDYRYAILLNSDAAPLSPGWVAPLMEFMESHPGYGACQPKLKSYRRRDEFEYAGAAGGMLDRNGFPYCRGRIFGTVEKDEGQYDETADVFWATGACMMVRISDYILCGGLDKEFFAHMEEIDLCWRLQLHGRKIAVVPQSEVYHLGAASLSTSNPRKTYLNFRNNLLLLYKNLPDSVRKSTLIRRRLIDAIAWAKFILTLEWRNAMAVVKAHRDFKKMRHNYTTAPERDLLHTVPSKPNILVDYYLRGKRSASR